MNSTTRVYPTFCLLAAVISTLWIPPAFSEMQQCRDTYGKPYFTDLGCPINKYNKQKNNPTPNLETPESGGNNRPVTLPQKYQYTPPQETPNTEVTQETVLKEKSSWGFKTVIVVLVLIAMLFVFFKFNVIKNLILAKKQSAQNTEGTKKTRFETLHGDTSIFENKTAQLPEQSLAEPYEEQNEEPDTTEDFLIFAEDKNFEEPDLIQHNQDTAEENFSQENQALEKELLTSYTPERPLIFDVESLSNDFTVGEKLIILSCPSLKDLLKDINHTEILYTDENYESMLSQKSSAYEVKRIFRLIHTQEKLDISVFLKEPKTHKKNNQVYYSYKISIAPLS